MNPTDPFAALPGGFSPQDGTIGFYLRVRSYLSPASRVLDLGAGRGRWYEDDPVPVRRWVRDLRPDVAELVAADVDEAVLKNRAATRCVQLQGPTLPFEDAAFDAVISDYVLEHVADPGAFVTEVRRVLKPGGVFCARTPHRLHYVALANRLAPGRVGRRLHQAGQPDRKAEDVFPALYRMNDLHRLRELFAGWDLSVLVVRGDPAYYFGSRTAFAALRLAHAVAPWPLVGNLQIFARKPASLS